MNLAKCLACLLLLSLGLGCAQVVFAQGTDLGTIRGSVADASGALVPNAKVLVIDLATNTTRETATNSQGEYQMFGLRPGNYKVSVSAPDMGTTDLTGIVLNGSDVVNANAVLKVVSKQEAIEVTAEVPTINTADQTISDTITSQAVIDLPRDSRDVYSFLYLNPNITQSGVDGQFKFLGSESYGANFTLDGQRSNGGIFGEHTNSQPSLEAVGDVNVLSNDFSAEYGGIANIRVTTKRGQAAYHGSMFYNNENSAFAALTQFDKIGKEQFSPTPFESKYPNPYFNLTDVGASFGGPVPGLKKTWFFAAYERNWNIAPVNVSSLTLPHPTLYTGDFSLVDDAKKPAVPAGVVLTPDEIANDTVGGLGQQFITIPSRLLNPTVQSLINTYFPKIGLSAPINSATGQIGGDSDPTGYHSLLPGRGIRDVGTLRLDHDFTDRDQVNAIYNGAGNTFARNMVQTPYTGLGLTQNESRNDTLSLSYTRVISDHVVNELRGGFNREQLRTHSNTTLEGFLSSIGFDQSDIDAYGAVVGPTELATHGHPAVTFGRNFAIFQNGNRNTDRPADQNLVTFGDTLTWVIGKHNLKMGADFVRNGAVDGFAVNRGNVRGSMTYGNAKSTDPFAQFLLGLPATTVTYVNLPRPAMDVYNWEQGFFFQDDWKVSSRLTLNLGLRYELITPFVENHDLMANFDPNFVDQATGKKGRFIIPSDKTRKYLDSRILNQFVVTDASQSGLNVGGGLVREDKNNFAPRVGAAFRLTDKSVIRGGYGFYYPTSAAQGIRDPIATNPFNQSLSKSFVTTPLQPWPGFSHGFSPLTGGDITTNFASLPSINAVPVGLQQPRVQQYNVTYERELARDTSIRFSYLGTYQSGLIAGVDLNEIPANNTPFGTSTCLTDGCTQGDGVTACDPVDNGDCLPSAADQARQPFPGLGDYLFTYGNYGHARSDAFQTQFEHRYAGGLMLNISYTYLSQRSTALDTENSSLGGVAYNPFQPERDYGQESFIPHNRFVAYGIYDLPVGKGKKFGASMSGWANTLFGGWQTTFNMFAKSGAGFTPYWVCDDCGPISPGNVGVGSVDAVGDFNNTSFRPTITGNYNHRTGDQIWDPTAFGLPLLGADMFSNPTVARRNQLTGPGAWGVNLGVHKDFHIGERFTATLGADVDNLFNHFLFQPDSDYGGGGGPFAMLGDFLLRVDPNTLQLAPISPDDVTPNPDFGRLVQTFSQEGVSDRRKIRLRLRITF
jgi:hypothetical protein